MITGNSLKAANDIAKNIENCKVVPMKNKNINEGEYEYIGFVFHVYFAGVPKIVYEFLDTLNTENIKNAYIFTVATCGGSMEILLQW